MKKVLFATTALVATAGMAAADVSLDGLGHFGLIYNEGRVDKTSIEQRFRLNINATAESDNGLQSGARARIETNDGADSKVRVAEFNVESGGFRLDVGNTSDVIDSGDVLNYYGYGVGLTSIVETSTRFDLPASGISGDGDVPATIKLRYTTGGFTVAASVTDDRPVAKPITPVTRLTTMVSGTTGEIATAEISAKTISRDEWQVGLGYSFGNYNAGVAFGNEKPTIRSLGVDDKITVKAPNRDFWTLGFDGEVGAFAFTVLIANIDEREDTAYGLSAKYDVGAATEIRFAYSDNGDGTRNSDVYGIGFRHSLGGGVSLQGGAGEVAGSTVADLGVVFNF